MKFLAWLFGTPERKQIDSMEAQLDLLNEETKPEAWSDAIRTWYTEVSLAATFLFPPDKFPEGQEVRFSLRIDGDLSMNFNLPLIPLDAIDSLPLDSDRSTPPQTSDPVSSVPPPPSPEGV